MRRFLATVGVLSLLALPAQASLLGTQVNGALVNPGSMDLFAGNTQPAIVASPGVEFVFESLNGNGALTSRSEADSDANSLTIRFFTAFLISFFEFDATFDFLTPGVVTGISVAPRGTITLTADPVLTGDQLTFTTAETVAMPGGTTMSVILLLSTGDSTPVPAPGALAVFGVALLGLDLAQPLFDQPIHARGILPEVLRLGVASQSLQRGREDGQRCQQLMRRIGHELTLHHKALLQAGEGSVDCSEQRPHVTRNRLVRQPVKHVPEVAPQVPDVRRDGVGLGGIVAPMELVREHGLRHDAPATALQRLERCTRAPP
jgi:hypothetical protein